MSDNFNYIVSKKKDGCSLKELFNDFHLAKNRFNYLIDNKKIMVNDTIVTKRDYILKCKDVLNVDLSDFKVQEYHPIRYNLEIIYEDDYLLVVNKPSGVIIYDDEIKPTMANYISYYYQKTGQSCGVRHVHRLDKYTSGLLVYAKDMITHAYLSNLFEEKDIKKEYYAKVFGIINESGHVDKKISRNRHNNLMITSDNGLDALTIYKPLVHNNNNTLLDVQIKSGRKHQIRVHMASIGHPLVGDVDYGGPIGKYILICHHIGFYNEITNKWNDFNLNYDLEELLNEKNV